MGIIKRIFSKNPIETGSSNPVLRKISKPVEKVTPTVLRTINKMITIIEENQYTMPGFVNVGLAAPQLGHLLRIIAFRKYPNDKVTVLINPRIIQSSKNTMIMNESCNSLPNIMVPVKRSTRITAEGTKLDGKKIEIRAKGFLARVIQHETDHLNGILIVDKVEKKS